MTVIAENTGARRDEKKLPDGWRWARLGNHVTKVGSGVTPTGGQSSYLAAGIPLIRSQNVHMNRFGFDGLAFISRDQDGQMYGSRVIAGDVLLNITGASIGRVCVVPSQICPANVNQHVSIIRSDGAFDPAYLSLYISSPDFQRAILDMQGGATRQALTKALIENFRIPLPPLPEQNRIAAVLSHQLAQVARAQQALEKQLQAAAVLPAAYLREIFTSPTAQAWPRKRLGDVAEVASDLVDPRLPEYAALPHVNGQNIESGTGRLFNVKTAAQDRMTSPKYVFEANDVLYSKLRPYLRKVTVARFRGVCSADMYPLRVKGELLRPQFLALMLLSEEFTRYSDGESRRARMPKLNRDQLFAWPTPIPPIPEQEGIEELMHQSTKTLDRLRLSFESQLTAINHLPAALLRRAINGET